MEVAGCKAAIDPLDVFLGNWVRAMPICNICNQWYEIAGEGCPRCDLSEQADGASGLAVQSGLAALARLCSWAEAGFFEDFLRGNGIAAELRPNEQFDAVAGHWRHDLTLLVPANDFDRARTLMQSELEDSTAIGETASQADSADRYALLQVGTVEGAGQHERYDQGPPLWKPLAVVLVAGGLAYLGTRGLQPAQPVRGEVGARPVSETSDLWQYLRRTGGVWEQAAGPASPRRRMWHDRRSGTLYVEQDHDNDGRFERQLEFDRGRQLRRSRQLPAAAEPDR